MAPSSSVIARLGVAQTLAWGSTYYLPAMLATPMAKDLGVSTPTMFAAFSASPLLVSALLGPTAGRMIGVIWFSSGGDASERSTSQYVDLRLPCSPQVDSAFCIVGFSARLAELGRPRARG